MGSYGIKYAYGTEHSYSLYINMDFLNCSEYLIREAASAKAVLQLHPVHNIHNNYYHSKYRIN